jgi:hypothetical protein
LQIVNKETDKSTVNNKKIETNWRANKIKNPKTAADLFKSYVIEIVQILKEQISKA